jgi:hypothetical protein
MTDTTEPIPEPLRDQARWTFELACELRGEALSGPVVLQPSDVEKVEMAVNGGRALEPIAKEAGLEIDWARMVETAHTLHYELSHRLRDAEDLTVGTDALLLIQAMRDAASRLMQR